MFDSSSEISGTYSKAPFTHVICAFEGERSKVGLDRAGQKSSFSTKSPHFPSTYFCIYTPVAKA
jgi:hypothetical protein